MSVVQLDKFKGKSQYDFETIAEDFLKKTAHRLEDADEESMLEVLYNDGVLNIIVENDEQDQFVANKNSGARQIWYSSPVTGAKYFEYDESQENFVHIKDKNISLYNALEDDLKKLNISLKVTDPYSYY